MAIIVNNAQRSAATGPARSVATMNMTVNVAPNNPAPSGGSNQRLGLHVTSDELAIWQTRMTDNVNTIHGKTFKFIYDNRIKADADTFVAQSHPGGDGQWDGWTSAGCVPNSGSFGAGQGGSPWGRGNGGLLAKSAFVYLLTGNTSYADPVKTELLNQITEPGTDFSNTTKWCNSSLDYGQNIIEDVPWLNRLLIAYDYLNAGGYTGFTAQNHTDIKNWFSTVATRWSDRQINGFNNRAYPGIYGSTPQDFTCSGSDCTSNFRLLYQGGPTSKLATQNNFNDIASILPMFCVSVGIITNDSSLIDFVTRYIIAFIRLGIFDAGATSDYGAWADCNPQCPGSMWAHTGADLGPLIQAVDHYARSTGDTSLYSMTASTLIPNGSGGTVGLQTALELFANLATGATILKTGDGSKNLTWLDGTEDRYMHHILAAANMYYQSSAITAAVEQALKSGSGDTSSDCIDPGNAGCFSSDAWSWWPDLPFMWGKLQGQVNPYVFV